MRHTYSIVEHKSPKGSTCDNMYNVQFIVMAQKQLILHDRTAPPHLISCRAKEASSEGAPAACLVIVCFRELTSMSSAEISEAQRRRVSSLTGLRRQLTLVYVANRREQNS